MNVLSVGNSFSMDAQRYLHDIARANGDIIEAVNLYIGGCSLYTHFSNIMADAASYELCVNGHGTNFKHSVKEALLNREWDVVTLQQASHFSVDYATYQPYLTKIADYIRQYCPKAKIAIHQTWAYEQGSELLNQKMGYSDHKDMFADIKDAYSKAYDDIGADILIPSGELFQKLLASGIPSVHRDTFHAKYGLGRYALSLLWYRVLTGKSVMDIEYSDFDEAVSDEEISIIKKCVEDIYR